MMRWLAAAALLLSCIIFVVAEPMLAADFPPIVKPQAGDSGWIKAGKDTVKLVYSPTKSWHDARQACKDEGHDLFVPDSTEKITAINKVRNELGRMNTAFWMDGITKEDVGNYHFKVTSADVPNHLWAPGYPRNLATRFCVNTGLQTDGQRLRDSVCTTQQAYICCKKRPVSGGRGGHGGGGGGWVFF